MSRFGNQYQFLRSAAELIISSAVLRPYIGITLSVEEKNGTGISPKCLCRIGFLHPEARQKPAEQIQPKEKQSDPVKMEPSSRDILHLLLHGVKTTFDDQAVYLLRKLISRRQQDCGSSHGLTIEINGQLLRILFLKTCDPRQYILLFLRTEGYVSPLTLPAASLINKEEIRVVLMQETGNVRHTSETSSPVTVTQQNDSFRIFRRIIGSMQHQSVLAPDMPVLHGLFLTPGL